MTLRAIWLRRLTAATTAGGLLLLAAPGVVRYVDAPGESRPEITLSSSGQHTSRAHPRRHLVHYVVRSGDTATGLAVRFHAWTDELLRVNHLTAHSTLRVGRHLKIPVVRAAARRHHRHHHRAHHRAQHRRHHRAHARREAPRQHHKAHHPKTHRLRHHHRDPSRATVRRSVIRVSHRHQVAPNLALAVAWQESGWQMDQVSSAGAIGAMQVMPATGRWTSQLVGRRLHLHRLHDNATAGVVLLKVLHQQARRKRAIAGYYQGLASVREHGMYPSTRRYVANVLALKRLLRRGWNPS